VSRGGGVVVSLFFLCCRESVCDGACTFVLFGLEVSFVLCSCLLFPGLVTLLVGVVFGGLRSDGFLWLCGVLGGFLCICGVLGGVTLYCCMELLVDSFPIGVMFLGLPKGGVGMHDLANNVLFCSSVFVVCLDCLSLFRNVYFCQ